VPELPEGVAIESQLPEGVSWASMLRDASDLARLVDAPDPSAHSMLFSSSSDTNKVILAHLAPEILGDLDHGFFLNVGDKSGYVEATLAEVHGAGALTWMWSANPVGEVMIYIDDREKPTLQMPFAMLLDGAFLPVGYPFSAFTALGHNLHFPIIHKEYCRVVLRVHERKELASLFYQIAWNSINSSLTVHPFNQSEIASSAALLGSLAKRFSPDKLKSVSNATPQSTLQSLPAKESQIFFRSDNSGIIRSMTLTAPAKTSLQPLWIEAYWDGVEEAALSCPLSMLAGVSLNFEDTTSLPCTVRGGEVVLRWQMPYGPGSRLIMRNTGNQICQIKAVAYTEEKGDTSCLLRFHANYVRKDSLALNERNVLCLADMVGRGQVVGCSIRVDSRSAQWWGEGDQIIWLDETAVPAWRGTGTEDYFGFAWCSDKTFDHPFRGQTRADGSRTNHRIAGMHRYHLLDRLPFHSFCRFEMEAWGLGEGAMDYEVLVSWYGEKTWRSVMPSEH